MSKKDQEASWEKKRYKEPPKNDVKPVPEIQHGAGSRKSHRNKGD